jgi:hypothetical protein
MRRISLFNSSFSFKMDYHGDMYLHEDQMGSQANDELGDGAGRLSGMRRTGRLS